MRKLLFILTILITTSEVYVTKSSDEISREQSESVILKDGDNITLYKLKNSPDNKKKRDWKWEFYKKHPKTTLTLAIGSGVLLVIAGIAALGFSVWRIKNLK